MPSTNGTGVVQPLTQLFRVKAANDVARAEAEATRGKARGLEDETALRVHQIYYRILIADVRRRAVLARIQASEDLQRERIQQVRYGSALEADLIESRAHALQARQELLTTELQRSDLQMQLNDVIGLPLTTPLLLDPNVSPISGPSERCERDACVREALESHPEIAEARAQVEKAASAVRLAKYEFVPDVEAFARYSFQNNVPFLAGPLRHGRRSRERRPVRGRPKARRRARARDAARAGQGEPRADFGRGRAARADGLQQDGTNPPDGRGLGGAARAARRVPARGGRTARATAARSARRRRSRPRRSSRRRRRCCNRSSITCKPPTKWMRRSGDDLSSPGWYQRRRWPVRRDGAETTILPRDMLWRPR